MLSTATDGAGNFKVMFEKPDTYLLGRAAQSHEYEIEYQSADRTLREGDTMTIARPDGSDAGSFKVREAPYVSGVGNAADGTFMKALLTQV